jgi:hypothetical protein
VKVQEQAEGTPGKLEIADELRHVDGQHPVYCFELEHDRPFDHEIRDEREADRLIAINER